MGPVEFLHYDPYSQCFSKVVRGFTRDLDDARHFVSSGMVDAKRLGDLVGQIPDSAFARYPSLSPGAVRQVVDDFVEHHRRDSRS